MVLQDNLTYGGDQWPSLPVPQKPSQSALQPIPSPSHPDMHQVPAGRPDTGHYLSPDRNRAHQWGQLHVVEFVLQLSEYWNRNFRGTQFGVADLSFENGGQPPGHNTHWKGLFVDIRFPRTDGRHTYIDENTKDHKLIRCLAYAIFDLAADRMHAFIHENTQLENEIKQYRTMQGLSQRTNLHHVGNHLEHFHIEFPPA